MKSHGWRDPLVVSSITIIIIIGEIQLESLLCCHYWNDGLPFSHCVNGQIGRPTGNGERTANYYNGMSRQAIGRQRSMWILSGWKRKRGESVHFVLLVLVMMLISPKSCLWTTSLWCDMTRSALFMSSLKALCIQIVFTLHQPVVILTCASLNSPPDRHCLEQ